MQTAWARENQIPYQRITWFRDIITAQIRSFQPEILFIDDHLAYPPAFIAEVRQSCPCVRLVVGWCSFGFTDASAFKAYDLMLSCIPELVEQFRQMGQASEQLNHGFDRRVLQHLDPSQNQNLDFCFIGQIVRSRQFHLERDQLLEALVAQIPIHIYSPSAEITRLEQIKARIKQLIYWSGDRLRTLPLMAQVMDKIQFRSEPPQLPVNPRLKPYLQKPVFGLEMYQTLHNSKVTLNHHIRVSPNSASNMRLYEATGVGTCLLTDWKKNLHQFFEPDREVVTYRSVEECLAKVTWLLEHPQERRAIALAGQQRTLREHNFEQRAAQLDQILKQALS